MTDKVWIVSWNDYDEYDLKHVCATEQLAEKRRQELIKEKDR